MGSAGRVTFAIGDYAKQSGALVPPLRSSSTPSVATRRIAPSRRHWRTVLLRMSSVTANSRMIYAFSRTAPCPARRSGIASTNGPVHQPTRSGWRRRGVHSRLPYLWNTTAYAAVTSIAVIACTSPISSDPASSAGRRELPARSLAPRPLELRCRVGAVAWVGVISVLFVLPQVSPIKVKTFNYAVVAVAS